MFHMDQNLLVRGFVKALLVCSLIQLVIIFTSRENGDTSVGVNYRGSFSEPSPYVDPENNYRNRQSIHVPLLQIIWHKIRYFFQSRLHKVYTPQQLFNSWDSRTLQQYFRPSRYRITKIDYPFVIKGESICPESFISPIAVIFVHSLWTSRAARDDIRNTWASGKYNCSVAKSPHIKMWTSGMRGPLIDFDPNEDVRLWKNLVRHVFLFGLPDDKDERKQSLEALAEESRLYGDIVVSDFHDTYRNLTIKSLAGLRWAEAYCPEAHLLLKTDDDVFVHVPRMLSLMTRPRFRDVIVGRWTYGIGCDVEREGRYALPYRAYPFEGGFPPHVKGGLYSIPWHIAVKLVDVAPYMPYTSIEDVHITGILRSAVGAKAVPFPSSECYNELVDDLPREVSLYLNGPRIASHHLRKDMQMINYTWNVLQNYSKEAYLC